MSSPLIMVVFQPMMALPLFPWVSHTKLHQKKKLCLVPFVKLSQKSLPAFFSSRKFTTKFSIPQKSSGCNFQSPKGAFFPPVTIIPVADMGEGPRAKKTYPLPLSSRSVKPFPKAWITVNKELGNTIVHLHISFQWTCLQQSYTCTVHAVNILSTFVIPLRAKLLNTQYV